MRGGEKGPKRGERGCGDEGGSSWCPKPPPLGPSSSSDFLVGEKGMAQGQGVGGKVRRDLVMKQNSWMLNYTDGSETLRNGWKN